MLSQSIAAASHASGGAESGLAVSGALRVCVGQYSDKGLKPSNEDAIGIRIPDGPLLTTKGIVAVISDGVSAAEGGAKASAMSVSGFLADYYSTPESWRVETASARVLTALNRWLYGLGQDYRDARKGYVCTLSALILKSCTAHLLHVGDSRVYRYRDGELMHLSQDHASQIGRHQSYLTRALGMDVKLDVDYRQWPLRVGDLYLLTTDGVHGVLTDMEISQTLAQMSAQPITDAQCEHVSHALVSKALAVGSQDNLSCQLVYVAALPSQKKEDLYLSLSHKPFPPPLSVGMTLDGYRVQKVLHQSQRSQVYLVNDPKGRSLCMKTPSVNYLDDAAYIERFMLESWIGSRINSPYVVRVVDNHVPKSALYYLTDYSPGMTLSQWCKHYPQPAVEAVLGIVVQIELGLRAFHRREVLHHDVKPDNILIQADTQVKLIDFGACQVKGILEIDTPLVRDTVLGTADYSAPEVISGMASDSRSDLFSLAVICYEMLTGRLPFEGKLAKCRHPKDYLRLKYVPVFELNPMVPAWLDEPIKKALTFDPRYRQADTCEFIYAITRGRGKVMAKAYPPLLTQYPLRTWQIICVIELGIIVYLCLG